MILRLMDKHENGEDRPVSKIEVCSSGCFSILQGISPWKHLWGRAAFGHRLNWWKSAGRNSRWYAAFGSATIWTPSPISIGFSCGIFRV